MSDTEKNEFKNGIVLVALIAGGLAASLLLESVLAGIFSYIIPIIILAGLGYLGYIYRDKIKAMLKK